ncbi:MAG TPA: extracellular solute-binding protein [Jiangellaceae bacterium]|nr:extracellular solute-binding protein [Jiangellaceae bacterium]
MRTTTGLRIGAAALALVLTACTGDDESSDAAEDAAEPSGHLTVWIMDPGNSEAQGTIDATGAAFEGEHEGVTIDIEYVPPADAHDRFVTGIAAGLVPDLAEMGTTWTPGFGEQGALAPVQQAEGVDYVDALVESGTVDGTTYGYPWYADVTALIYRTDVFDQAGVEPPATWDEIRSVGDAIAATVPGIAPMHVVGGHVPMMASLVWGAGGEIATRQDDTWRAGVDSAAGREAFGFFETLWKKGWSPVDAVEWDADDARAAFTSGESAMIFGRGSDLSAVLSVNPDLEGKLGIALVPAGPAGSHDAVAGGSHLVVFQESDQQELAHAFARYMIAPGQVATFAEQIGFLPGTVAGVEASIGDDLDGVFRQQLVEHSRSYPPAGWWGAVEGGLVLPEQAQRLMRGEITAEEAAAAANAAIQHAIG